MRYAQVSGGLLYLHTTAPRTLQSMAFLSLAFRENRLRAHPPPSVTEFNAAEMPSEASTEDETFLQRMQPEYLNAFKKRSCLTVL